LKIERLQILTTRTTFDFYKWNLATKHNFSSWSLRFPHRFAIIACSSYIYNSLATINNLWHYV